MGETVAVLIASGLMIYFELIPLYRKKEVKTAVIYTVFLAVFAVLAVMICSGVRLPTVSSLIETITGR